MRPEITTIHILILMRILEEYEEEEHEEEEGSITDIMVIINICILQVGDLTTIPHTTPRVRVPLIINMHNGQGL